MHTKNVNRLFRQTIFINTILFFIVVITVCQISFTKVSNILTDEMETANKTILEQTMQNVDSQLVNIDILVSDLAKKREINDFSENFEPDSMTLFSVNEKICDIVNKNISLSDLQLYSKITNTVIGYSGYYEGISEPARTIISDALNKNKTGWIEVPESSLTKLSFVKVLQNRQGILLARVNESLLYEAISKYRTERKNGVFFVTDKSGITLSHSDKAYIGTNISSQKFAKIIFDKNTKYAFKTEYQNQKCLMVYANSKYTGWTYISAIPEKILYKQINHGKIWVYIISSIIFFISVAAAYLLLKSFYTPVDKFVHSIANSILKNNPSKGVLNDFGTLTELEDTFKELIERHKQVKYEYEKSAKALSWNIIMNVLLGFDTNYDKFISSLEAVNISLYPSNFIVMLLDVSAVNLTDENQNDEFVLVYNIIMQRLESLINKEAKGCTCSVGEHGIVAVVSFENNFEAENLSTILIIANDLIKFSQKHFEYKLFISIGKFYEDVSGLRNSYNEAACAMKYKTINQDNSILMIDDYLTNCEENETISYISGVIDEFVKNFKDFDENALSEHIYGLMNIITSKNINIDICKQFVLQTIMLTVNQYIKPIDRHNNIPTGQRYLNSNQIIDSCSDIPSMFDAMLKILSNILNIYNQSQSISFSQNALAAQTIEYIDNNYMNPDTSLSAVAELFKVSDSHLSRVFKQSTGKRFMEYLIYRRIEKAKELLLSNKYKVNDIAALVGYDNQISFMRIFKKYTGVTPSEYKNSNLEQ